MLSPFEWCVVTSFYQSLQAMSPFFALFNLRNLLYLIEIEDLFLEFLRQRAG